MQIAVFVLLEARRRARLEEDRQHSRGMVTLQTTEKKEVSSLHVSEIDLSQLYNLGDHFR